MKQETFKEFETRVIREYFKLTGLLQLNQPMNFSPLMGWNEGMTPRETAEMIRYEYELEISVSNKLR